ncbi:uncharacterized protein LOC130739537 [Lotus japonicus]|uniref:uncharacterized protein LOC130739537 n=1 Tax=Lotus japonicus TaxID=34305 RepID=UPI00258E4DF8|nr:uncharacterized protein LOC130739537 [Lotus japonicus]
MSNSENSRKNAKWDQYITRALLKLCMEEIRKSGKPGIAYKAKKWEEIREDFGKQTNRDYTVKQLKNRMDNLRTDWVTWKQLKGKETGLGWNNQSGTIEADATWWDAKINENSKYAKFRYNGLEFHDELEFIFGETVATSQDAWTPAMSLPSESGGRNTTPDVLHQVMESDDDDFNLEDDVSPMENNQLKKKRKVTQDHNGKVTIGKGKVGSATAMRKSLDRLVEAAENHNEVEKDEIAATSHVHGKYSIPNCIEVLKSVKEEGLLTDRQFNYALELLTVSENRVIFMSLIDSMEALVGWIKFKYVE